MEAERGRKEQQFDVISHPAHPTGHTSEVITRRETSGVLLEAGLPRGRSGRPHTRAGTLEIRVLSE